MKKLMTGECHLDNIFHQIDPTQFVEGDFEAEVVKALTCLLPEYLCGIFAGEFVLDGERRKADLALIHKKLTHWFVVEVELTSHSFENHVLPQIRCFRYGEPDQSCVTSLVRGFKELTRDQAESLLRHVPRYVAVVCNLPSPDWTNALQAVDVHHLTVSVYRDRNGRTAHEVEGRLTVRAESLGFAQYSAIHHCLRIPKGCGLQVGRAQIIDQFGNLGNWTIQDDADVLWIRKDQGSALIPHGKYVQIIRGFDGRISLRLSQ